MHKTPIALALLALLALSGTAQANPVTDKITNYNNLKSTPAKNRIDLSTQIAATSRDAALEVKTVDPQLIERERLARETAFNEGTTLEAKLYIYAKANNVSDEVLNKSMGWPEGYIQQWLDSRWEVRAGERRESAMLRYAQSHNMTTLQMDQAMGWTPGTLDAWAVKNGH